MFFEIAQRKSIAGGAAFPPEFFLPGSFLPCQSGGRSQAICIFVKAAAGPRKGKGPSDIRQTDLIKKYFSFFIVRDPHSRQYRKKLLSILEIPMARRNSTGQARFAAALKVAGLLKILTGLRLLTGRAMRRRKAPPRLPDNLLADVMGDSIDGAREINRRRQRRDGRRS
jgi:hypothetical protein